MTVNHDVVGSSPTCGVLQNILDTRRVVRAGRRSMIGNRVGRKLSQGFESLTLHILYFLFYGPLVKRLRHRPFTAVTRVRVPYGSLMEDYPSPAEGNGLENRQACKSVQGFESLILLNIIAGWSSWQLVGLITRRS